MNRVLILFVSTVLFITATALPAWSTCDITYEEHLFFTSKDGTEIAGNVFIPQSDDPNQTFPAILFINSWAMEEHEYIVQAAKFAREGYVVLSYSARGWGKSGGKAGIGTEGDMDDVRAAVAWLGENTPTNMEHIGASGISYGAGTSLLALAQVDEIQTAVAMSTFVDVFKHLYGWETSRLTWGSFLIGSGYLTGNMDPILPEIFKDTLHHRDIDLMEAWSVSRSPITWIEAINEKKKPVYICQNFADYMFWPNLIVDYFEQLTGPKKLDLSQGIHASAELKGLAGLPSELWDNTHAWFDYHLKGKENGIMDTPEVTMEVKNTGIRDTFETWESKDLYEKSLALSPRTFFSNGKLTENGPRFARTNRIVSGIPSGATAGIPILSPFADAHINLPILAWIPGLNRLSSVAYQSARQKSTLQLRGAPTLDLWITPSTPDIQIIGYLYDMSKTGLGTLITHGPITKIGMTPDETEMITLEFATTAYDLPPGHKLVLVLDTADPAYGPASLTPFKVKLPISGKRPSVLRLTVR
ncbi:CocE/NonD family hydrolase [Desulfoluna sp.]|uniref:CocE/NonD family hydrolase n=1 Tax=Desulfoluna sp. TaxID=2045199 RepID=UPI002625CBEB|nr:CocE/NonD family hydrolase [Desulfoluna sp.]